jgi:hypothetical protein
MRCAHPLAGLCVALTWISACHSGEFRVPVMPQPPTLDGKIEPAEWAVAAGFDGFGMGGKLDQRRVRCWVGATADCLFVAIRSQLPDEGKLLAAVDRDTLKLVYDDSIEVWIDPTPGTEHGQAFQMLANSLGRKAYDHHARGNVAQNAAWRGNWEVANGFHDGHWHCEVSAPIAEIAPGRRATDGAWGLNVCRNWKQPWGLSSLGGGAYAPSDRFVFAETGSPVVGYEERGDRNAGRLDGVLTLRNSAAQPVTVRAQFLLKRDLMPEVNQSESMTLAPGGSRTVVLKVDDQSSKKMELLARVTSAAGETTYYERTTAWEVTSPYRWVAAAPVVLPVDFQFAYYPYPNRMRILADVSGMPKDAQLERLTATVRKKGASRAVKSVVFDSFHGSKQELAFDLPPLNGQYEIAMTAAGKNVPTGELVKEFERTVYEWEHNSLGKSREVYPPFTPLEVSGKTVRTVLREHEMNDSGLWQQVTAKGQPLLNSPMRYWVQVDGRYVVPTTGRLSLRKVDDQAAEARTTVTAGALQARANCAWDYDGTMRMDLTLLPSGGKTIEKLLLEIPLRADQATHYHAMGDGIRNTLYERVPQGDGVVWTAEKVQANDLPAKFCSYLYVGTPVRGLSWFAENDRGWSWDPARPNVELVRSNGTVTIRVHLISKPVVIDRQRTLTFGLLAAPVKPKLGDWRYQWNRDRYTLLGTDINWLALGDCGSVYPAGKDLFLWEMIKRGNRERLSNEEVQATIDRGLPLFRPYGEERVESWGRHVRHNLISRYGNKMVFYYNRASCQLFDEFETFKDEWCLTDFRTVGKGNGIGEIKIVPSESYLDHALYWYGKSFDLGGNQGVYWDNWFFVPSYNTAITDAYKRDDGSVMPATGLWAMRELSKRTFQYMNERGMTPITMPHMTSTNILPMHSFATVQYDWEWKYSEGDVQYRFPRDYLLLVSNGELAGTWPVLLGDHGKLADDPWTQRTFAGVCLVHELDGGGLPQVWQPLREPIYRLLGDPTVQVYRYWDERPQPVVANNPDLPTIVYSVPGKEAVFVVTSYAEQDVTANVSVDAKALGLGDGCRLTDVESGESFPVRDGRATFPLKKHAVREFGIAP